MVIITMFQNSESETSQKFRRVHGFARFENILEGNVTLAEAPKKFEDDDSKKTLSGKSFENPLYRSEKFAKIAKTPLNKKHELDSHGFEERFNLMTLKSNQKFEMVSAIDNEKF